MNLATSEPKVYGTIPKDSISDNRLQSRLAKKTASDLVIYFPTVFMQGAVGIITASIISKLFSPDQYGNYVLAFIIYQQLLLLTGEWLRQSLIRLIPEYRAKNQLYELIMTLIISEFVILFSITLGSLIVLVLTRDAIASQLFLLLVVAVIGAFFGSLISGVEEFYRIMDRPTKCCVLVLIRILSGLTLALIIGVPLDSGIVGFFIGLVIPSAVLVCWFSFYYGKKIIIVILKNKFSKLILKDAIMYSLPLVSMNAMGSIIALSDRYFINWYMSSYEVGIYSISYIIANQGAIFIILFLMRAADPIAMRTWETEGPKATTNYLSQLFRYYALLAIPALVGLVILGEDLIRLLSTSNFVEGAPVIGFVGFGVVFSGYSQILNRVFGLLKKTVIPLVTFAIAALVNILLNIILIPQFGYCAAAWTTLGSYFLVFVLNIIMSKRLLFVKLWGGYIAKAAISSTLMALVLYFCKSLFPILILNIITSISIGILSYTVFLVLLGEIRFTKFKLLINKEFK